MATKKKTTKPKKQKLKQLPEEMLLRPSGRSINVSSNFIRDEEDLSKEDRSSIILTVKLDEERDCTNGVLSEREVQAVGFHLLKIAQAMV